MIQHSYWTWPFMVDSLHLQNWVFSIIMFAYQRVKHHTPVDSHEIPFIDHQKTSQSPWNPMKSLDITTKSPMKSPFPVPFTLSLVMSTRTNQRVWKHHEIPTQKPTIFSHQKPAMEPAGSASKNVQAEGFDDFRIIRRATEEDVSAAWPMAGDTLPGKPWENALENGGLMVLSHRIRQNRL